MKFSRYAGIVVAVLALGAGLRAQVAVTTADLVKLEATAGAVDQQIKGVETTDPTLATDVRKTLGELRDDIAYLRVKMRRD